MLGLFGINKNRKFKKPASIRTITSLSLYDMDFAKEIYKGAVQDFTDPYNNNNFYRPYINYTARLDLKKDGSYILNPANRMKRTDLGLWGLQERYNYVLWNRDLTNSVWIKTNITTSKNQTGILGVNNSASGITATADNATIMQPITLAATNLFCSAFVKRLSGTGTLELTMDGGATWANVTTTSSWGRVNIPTANLANPTIGFRIGKNNDSFAIDFAQIENGNVIGAPLETTTASFRSWFDRTASYTNMGTDNFPDFMAGGGFGFYLELSAARLEEFFTIGTDSTPSYIGGVKPDGSVYFKTTQTPAGTFVRGWGTVNKIAGYLNLDGKIGIACNGVLATSTGNPIITALTHTDLCTNGSGAYCAHGYVPRVAFFNPGVLTNADLIAFTTP